MRTRLGHALGVSTLLLAPVPVAAEVGLGDDALPIVEKAFEAALANQGRERDYVYRERIEERRLDKHGEEKRRRSWTHDVTPLETIELRRLIARDDRPLDAKAAAREDRRLEKQLAKLRRETLKQRGKRRERADKEREEAESFLKQITHAFDFRLLGAETIDGVATHAVSVEPKLGYRPTSRETKILPHIRGTLWIAQDDHAWVRAELETLADVTWALVLKLRHGSRFGFERRKVDGEVWLVDRWYVRLRARAALVHKINREYTGTYSDFRRFTVESTVAYGPTSPR